MKNVTNKFLQDIQDTRNFGYIVTMNFANGETKVLDDPSDLMSSGCEIKTSAETNSFPLGNAIGKTLTLALPNNDDRWSEYDFYGCNIKVELTHNSLDSSIVLGYFTVISPETYGATVEIVGVDKMYKFDKTFNKNSVSCPISLMNLMVEACQQAQVSYQGAHFANDSYTISAIPDNLSCRDIIGQIAMLAGGNAIINDYGTVSIITYSMDRLYNQLEYDGGTFDTETTPYSDGDNLNGGDFTFSDTDEISGGTFNELRDYHVLFKGSKITLSTDDVVITGVQTTINDTVYPTGTMNEGYILSITNALLEGNTSSQINSIMRYLNDLLVFNDTITADHPKITGLRFRIFDIDHVSYPIADFADMCYVVDRKNRYYKSLVTDIAFQFKGYTTFKCTAEAPTRNSTKYTGNETKAIMVAKDLVEQEKTERELAIEETQQLINNSPGLYEDIVDDISGIPVETGNNIKFKFNSQCQGENNYDWVSMYVDYDINYATQMTYERLAIFERKPMNELAGQNIVIPKRKGIVTIHMYTYSDGTSTYWGWQIDSAKYTTDNVTHQPFTPVYDDLISATSFPIHGGFPMGTTHPYDNSLREDRNIKGSAITETEKPMYYVLHNKPELKDSKIWWVASADVMWVSNDYGRTFTASISADGNAIVNRLSAVGISADWINTGTITIGGSGTSAQIVMKDSSNRVIGGWDETNGIITQSYNSLGNVHAKIQLYDGNIYFIKNDFITGSISPDGVDSKATIEECVLYGCYDSLGHKLTPQSVRIGTKNYYMLGYLDN